MTVAGSKALWGQTKAPGNTADGPLPETFAPAHPHALRLQLRAFVDDAATLDRARRLLLALAPQSVRCVVELAASRVEAADGHIDGEGDEPAPSGVLLLTDSAGFARCCDTMLALREAQPGVPLIVFAQGMGQPDLARLLGCGVFDFVMGDGSDVEIDLRLRRALGLLPAVAPSPATSTCASLAARLIGRAPAFLKLVRRVPVIAASAASVLLLGETGTGKEVCAQAIHYSSPRARGPWVAINCAAIPPELVEDELFGHVRGAYTHAMTARQGLVQEAEGGTLFLDEIDSMPLAAQAKLLRFLQDKQYRVVGASQSRTADVRVVAASNRDLRVAASAGLFRQDLFFRLNVLNLTLPPLRERREDIPALAMHFIAEANRENGRHLCGLTPAALRALMDHDWPGNVRELRNAMQRAVLLAEGHALQAHDIELDGVDAPGAALVGDEPVSFREAKARAVEAFERHYLELLLSQSQGNITRAARAAQKNRRAFFELLRRHAIEAERYRNLTA